MLILFLVCSLRKPYTLFFLPGSVSEDTLSLENCLHRVVITTIATTAIYALAGIYFKHMANNNLD